MIGGDGPRVANQPYLLSPDQYPFTIAMFKATERGSIVWAITVLLPQDRMLQLLRVPPGRVWAGEPVDVAVIDPDDWPAEWASWS